MARGLGPGYDDQGPRAIAADCGGVRVVSVYVPNGRSLDSEHYPAKLAWLARLRAVLDETTSPDRPVAVCGDFNVAPEDRDVWDPTQFEGMTHVSAPEREALADLQAWGLVDAFRRVYDDDRLFSWWDYRGGSFHRHRGMRIDLILVTEVLADRTTWALIDRNARKGEKPSDHTPVFIDTARSDGPAPTCGCTGVRLGLSVRGRPASRRSSGRCRAGAPARCRPSRPGPPRPATATAAGPSDGRWPSGASAPTSSGGPGRPG